MTVLNAKGGASDLTKVVDKGRIDADAHYYPLHLIYTSASHPQDASFWSFVTV